MFDYTHLSPTVPTPSGPPVPITSTTGLRERIGELLGALPDPQPGSIILGLHGAMPVESQRSETFAKTFHHSSKPWIQMWEEEIFEELGKGQRGP